MPNFDEIERAYTRAKPSPEPGMDGFKSLVTGGSKWGAIAFVAVTACLAISAAADQIFGLGWGYLWRDFWAALGLCACGLIAYAIGRAWYAFIGFDKLSRDEGARPEKPSL